MIGLITFLIKTYLSGLIINIKGTSIHSQSHAIISLGRWTKVKILHAVIISEMIIKIIPLQIKNFFLLKTPQSKVAMANAIETIA
jgi:hypothetical protein